MRRQGQIGGGKAFRKMRLVPASDDRAERIKRLRNYDPALESMADSMYHIQHPNVRKYGREGALAVQNAYRDRFTSHSRQRIGMHAPEVAHRPRAPAQIAQIAQIAPLPHVQVPNVYIAKYANLTRFLETHPGAVARTDADELVIDGNVLRGTSFDASIRALYVNTAHPPPGLRQLALKLRDMRAPMACLSSRYARRLFTTQGGGGSFVARTRLMRVY